MNILNKISILPQYKSPQWTLVAIFCSTLILTLPSCKVKEGCPTKDYTNTMDKKPKRGKTNLFDKDMRKRMKK